MTKCSIQENPEFHIIRNDNGKGFIICNPITELNSLIDVVDKIINGTEQPYKILSNKSKVSYQPTELGLSLKAFLAYRSLYDGDFAYSPDLQLFFDCVKNYKGPFWDYPSDSEPFVNHATKFVEFMREEGRKFSIKKKIADWRRGPRKNHARLVKYVDSLFEQHARLLVIRLDLHHRKILNVDVRYGEKTNALIERERALKRNEFYFGEEPPKTDQTIERTTIKEIKADWKKWYDNARNKTSLFRDMVGHVVRYEFSKGAGYHIHVTLFFDGSTRQSATWLAENIGKYWEKTTDGRGYYFNCNREKYRNSGIGMVDYSDREKRKNLYTALAYLAKQDQHVREKSGSKQKLFTTGKMPDPPVLKLGRPRRKDQPKA